MSKRKLIHLSERFFYGRDGEVEIVYPEKLVARGYTTELNFDMFLFLVKDDNETEVKHFPFERRDQATYWANHSFDNYLKP